MLEKLVDTLLARGAVFMRMDTAAAEYRARVAAGEA